MREYMEPFGVRTGVDVHLYEEGRVSFTVHPDEHRAVITLETSAVRVSLYADGGNLRRLVQLTTDADAALTAEVDAKAA